MPQVAVVIPTHDRPDGLKTCLDAIVIPPAWDVEIIVVENASNTARDVVRRHGATYVHLDASGASRARNAGASRALGAEAIAFLDDDVAPRSRWLERIVAPILAGDADATIGGVHVVTQAEVPPKFLAFYVDTDYALDVEHPFLAGLNMAVRPAAFSSVGGFNEKLGPGALGVGGEDILLGLMLTAEGHRIQAVLDAEVDHYVPPSRFTNEELLKRAFGAGRADGWLTYHWHGARYRWLRLRLARSFVVSHLPARDFARKLDLIHRYGQETQLLAESRGRNAA